jgi:hypothetical protein
MRRAVNYLFGHKRGQSQDQVPTQSNGIAQSYEPGQQDGDDSKAVDPVQAINGEQSKEVRDTPSEAPPVGESSERGNSSLNTAGEDVPIDKIKSDLAWYKTELDEAGKIVSSQTEEIERLKEDNTVIREEFEKKQAMLTEQKKALEDHMVSVVVQQVKEARASEREEVQAKADKQLVSWRFRYVP